MITYFVTKPHSYTIETYLNTWGRPLSRRFRVVPYSSLMADTAIEFRPGTYIFSDIERMGPVMTKRIANAWREIADLGAATRIFNHPSRSMRRYELLRTLFEDGKNVFNAYRLVECRRPQRWPVFIRDENEHTKNLTGLLNSPEELDAAVAEIFEAGGSREDKMVVEFCDTRDDRGLFHKYTAFLIGDRVIPRDFKRSPHWVVLARDAEATSRSIAEERSYIEANPHEQQIREIFRLARIDYGKIDYGMLGGRMQVWEINTNPNIFSSSEYKVLASKDPADAESKETLLLVAEAFAVAFAEVDVRDASVNGIFRSA